MSRAESVKGTSGSENRGNETQPPRPGGEIKPPLPTPSQTSAENGHVKNVTVQHQEQRGSDSERRERPETERDPSAPVAPPLPNSRTDNKADEGTGTLQRSKPANMKEKVEKWRERRSDIIVPDRTFTENRRINNLK